MSSARRDRFTTPPRRRLRAWGAGYTWFVRITKIALPLIALLLIGMVISRMSHNDAQRLAELPAQDKTTPGQIELVQAKYEGMDAQGRPYVLTAEKAARDMKSAAAVFLERPEARVTLKDGNILSAAALHGNYNNTAGTLQLNDNVILSYNGGYSVSLKSLSVDIKNRSAVSTQSLTAQGPAGTLAAQNLDITEQGALITFGGPVHLTLVTDKSKGSTP